jgi:small-conductance mechanosensitive channel
MARRTRDSLPEGDENSIAQYLKERIYATLTGLAIVLVFTANSEHHDASGSFLTLVIGVLAIAAAGYLSDLVAHTAVHGALPHGAEHRIMLRIALGALSTVAVPAIMLGLAWAGVLQLETALRVSTIVYLVTLGVIGYGAVRRTTLPAWAKLLVFAVLVGFGALVVGVQVLAHSL